MSKFISWYCGEEVRPEYWEDIYNEYISLRENKSSQFILEIIKEISYLETKRFITTKCCEVLAIPLYSRELVMELKQLGYRSRFDFSNREQYMRDIKATISNSKRLTDKINAKVKELNKYKSQYPTEDVSRKDFEIWKITLWEWIGDYPNFDIISIADFCTLMNKYEAYCEIKNAEVKSVWQKTG